MRILCIAAHPDAEVLGCGGTLAKYAMGGHKIFLLVLGEGVMSRPGANREDIECLEEQCKKTSVLLGIDGPPVFLRFPDNRFDEIGLLTLVRVVERVIKGVCPDVIYTHSGSDLNIDHELTNRAVLTATRPVAGMKPTELVAFESPSSTEWSFGKQQFVPNAFVNIKETLDKKIEAVRIYKDEIRPFPHPRSPEALIARAKYWGSVSGLPAAEAFMVLRAIL